MDTIKLKHSISGGVHTFVDGDVRLVASRLKCDQYGNVRAYLKALVGDAHASSSNLNLTDQESREKFDFYARKQQPEIPWLAYVTQVNDLLLGWLDDPHHGEPGHGVVIEDLADLLHETFAEVRPVIEGILMPGTVLLAGKPKAGKSLLALYLGISVARGGLALGRIRVEQGDVLYLSLEDHKRRLQKRVEEMLSNDSTAPARGTFQFATTWPTLDHGGVEAIEAWLQAHPNARLVVVDTFVKVRGTPKTRDVYKGDYDAAAPLTALAAKYPQICILIIHHCSKRSDAEDFFDRFQNSTGLTAAVEGGMELRRTRGSPECTLEIAHKDLEIDTTHAIRHDPNGGWMLLGEANTVLLSEERQQVVDLLVEAGVPLHYKTMAADLGKREGTLKKLTWKMARDHQLLATGAGHYALSPTMLASINPDEPLVSGHQSHHSHQGHHGHQVTDATVPPGDSRVRPEGNQVTDDTQKEILPLVTRVPRLPQTDAARARDLDPDLVEILDAVNVTPIDDEPLDDMLLTPYDPTADISPAAQEADFTRRVQQMAATVRPKPPAAPAKLPREKAPGHNKHAPMFGHWKAKSSPPSDEPPPPADAMGEQRHNGGDGHDDLEVF